MGDDKMTFTDGNALTAAELNDFDTDSLTINDSTNEDKISINKSGTGIGNVFDIVNAGTSHTITCDNTGTGIFIEYKDNGTTVFEIKNDGSVDMMNHQISNVDYLNMRNKPSAPSTLEGRMYYNSTDNVLYYYDGTDWIPMGGTSPAFWSNSTFYTVYEADWGSGTIDAGEWDIYTYAGGSTIYSTVTSVNSNNAGGSAYEARLYSPAHNYGGGSHRNQIAQLTSKNIPSNRHIFCRTQLNVLGQSNTNEMFIEVGNVTDGYTSVLHEQGQSQTDTGSYHFELLIEALGSNTYDVYINGVKISSSLSKANGMQLRFRSECNEDYYGSAIVFIDDVRYSSWSVV